MLLCVSVCLVGSCVSLVVCMSDCSVLVFCWCNVLSMGVLLVLMMCCMCMKCLCCVFGLKLVLIGSDGMIGR